MAVSEVRASTAEAEEAVVVPATEVVVVVAVTIPEEMVSHLSQSGADKKTIDEEHHPKLQLSSTSMKERMISPILVGLDLLLVNVQLDLSHPQRVPLELLKL